MAQVPLTPDEATSGHVEMGRVLPSPVLSRKYGVMGCSVQPIQGILCGPIKVRSSIRI
jgi:hypothetical protein